MFPDDSSYVGPMGRGYYARQIPSDDLNVTCVFFAHEECLRRTLMGVVYPG